MTTTAVEKLKIKDVFRVKLSKRGLGRKAVVLKSDLQAATVSVSYGTIVGGGVLISEQTGWISLRRGSQVETIGKWSGRLLPGASGEIMYNNDAAETSQKGSVAMATKPKPKAKASSSKSKSAERAPRATDAELDRLAARVVSLRDDKGKSWGDIEAELDVAPSRLRALYNRGGGEPKGARAGKKSGGKAAPKPAARRAAKKKANPSAKA